MLHLSGRVHAPEGTGEYLWFSEEAGNKIGRVDMKGIHDALHSGTEGSLAEVPITYYPVPSRHTIMHRIIQGPDKTMWFTELGIDRLGRLTLDDDNSDQ